jgi:CHAT domain-containing protein
MLIITPSEHDVPWEFTHDEDEFWCTKYNIGRILGSKGNSKFKKPKELTKKNPKLMIIADPQENITSAKEEANKIESLLKDKIEIEILEGKDAKKQKIIDSLLFGNYDIVHYTGHANLDPEKPQLCHLSLNEQVIKYGEVSRLKFKSRPIFFINACSSAESISVSDKDYFGDRSHSMADAFLNAGALSYIGTMWPVQTTIASEFATNFYTNLKRHKIGESLQLARQNMKKKTHVVSWIPYILFGDPLQSISDRFTETQSKPISKREDKK